MSRPTRARGSKPSRPPDPEQNEIDNTQRTIAYIVLGAGILGIAAVSLAAISFARSKDEMARLAFTSGRRARAGTELRAAVAGR